MDFDDAGSTAAYLIAYGGPKTKKTQTNEDTPTTEEVRNVYCREYGSDLGSANETWYAMAGRCFDAWLADHDAKVVERERRRALEYTFLTYHAYCSLGDRSHGWWCTCSAGKDEQEKQQIMDNWINVQLSKGEQE